MGLETQLRLQSRRAGRQKAGSRLGGGRQGQAGWPAFTCGRYGGLPDAWSWGPSKEEKGSRVSWAAKAKPGMALWPHALWRGSRA